MKIIFVVVQQIFQNEIDNILSTNKSLKIWYKTYQRPEAATQNKIKILLNHYVFTW